MAVTYEYVGKTGGGGLSWTKVTGSQKRVAWNAADLTLTSADLGTGKQYLLAMRYTYVSGNPGNCYFRIQELGASAGRVNWAIDGPSSISTGTRQYELMVSRPFTSSGIVNIQFSPGYNSGTHVLSADLYYTEFPTL